MSPILILVFKQRLRRRLSNSAPRATIGPLPESPPPLPPNVGGVASLGGKRGRIGRPLAGPAPPRGTAPCTARRLGPGSARERRAAHYHPRGSVGPPGNPARRRWYAAGTARGTALQLGTRHGPPNPCSTARSTARVQHAQLAARLRGRLVHGSLVWHSARHAARRRRYAKARPTARRGDAARGTAQKGAARTRHGTL